MSLPRPLATSTKPCLTSCANEPGLLVVWSNHCQSLIWHATSRRGSQFPIRSLIYCPGVERCCKVVGGRGFEISRRRYHMDLELTRIVVGANWRSTGCRKTGCFQNLTPTASYEEGRQAEEPPLAQPEDLAEEVSRGVNVVEPCYLVYSSTVAVVPCCTALLSVLWSCATHCPLWWL